jgi:membrane protein
MTIGALLKKILTSWSEDNIPRLSAALAYYTIFSITPLLIIAVALLGLFLGPEASRGQIVDYISSHIGHETGTQIQNMIISASKPKSAKIAQFVGVIMLIIGMSGAFMELQNGLNTIWGVKGRRESNWVIFIWDRILSFLIVLAAAFLLLLSLILDIILLFISNNMNIHIPWLDIGFTLPLFSHFVSFIIITLLFTLMFKILPNTTIQWRTALMGAFITAILFTLGNFLLGLYLKYSITSIYGASSSLVVLLIWVYYASQIFFIGAEISKVISSNTSS